MTDDGFLSTALYGLATGGAALLFARILWGLAFAALLLVTLGHSVHDWTQVGSRLGWSRAIQNVGSILALAAGAWLTVFSAQTTRRCTETGLTCALPRLTGEMR